MKFYATGTKQSKQIVDGEKTQATKHVVISLNAETRVLAVQEAEAIASKEKIKLDGIYKPQNHSHDTALPMTKEFKKRKKERAGIRNTY